MNALRPILLIEDNPMDLDLTQRAFARRQLSNPLLTARDGEEALEHINHWDNGAAVPLLILLDLKLPKIDGIEVLRQLKNHAKYKTIPVIVLTTSAEDRDVQTVYDLGANSYIIKPLGFEHFIEMIVQIEQYWIRLNTPPR
jgi:CheY-like chemotaxis protein